MASLYHAVFRLPDSLRGKVVILMYHRVLSERELGRGFIQPGMYVRNDVFAMQMRFLSEHFRVLPFSDLLARWERGCPDREQRYCVLTFDDGWLDNYTNAFPVLKKYGIPATIFLATAFVNTSRWFWPDRIGYLLERRPFSDTDQSPPLLGGYPWLAGLAGKNRGERICAVIELCKRLPEEEIHGIVRTMEELSGTRTPEERAILNWDEVREMSQHGISFGSHSSTHRILTGLPSREVEKELSDSLSALQGKGIYHVPVFCYPNGNSSSRITAHVKAAGYRAAVSTRFGYESGRPEDIFRLKRIGVHNDISSTIPLFTWHISGLNRIPAGRGAGGGI